jgi:PTS system beta-glucosides-specific IIC component
MAKDYQKMGDEIIANLGGAENVTKLFHCATRLRFDLADKAKVDTESLKKIQGVMGVVESAGGIQIIIGNDVPKAFEAITEKYSIGNTGTVDIVENDDKQNIVSKLLNVLSAIIGPAIPLIMCSGLVSALLIILTKCGLNTESTTYQLINMVGNGALYLLPVLLAYSSAKKFGCDIMVSLFLGGLMISPTLLGFVNDGVDVTLFGLPVKAVDYSSTLIPIVLTIWVFSYVSKFVEKIIPDAVKFVFRPFVNIIIMIPIMLCVTGPIGSYCGDLICNLMIKINEIAPWACVLVVGCFAPFLVLTGMHLALIPLVMTLFATVGYDNMLFPAFIAMNFSQFGVAMACFFKTKRSGLKTLSLSCAITSFLAGVTEPTLYGICLRMKKPLIATWITCIVNAIFCAICQIKVYSFGAPSFFTMPIFLNPDGTMSNFYLAIAAAAITIVLSFVLTWVLGFDDSCYEE